MEHSELRSFDLRYKSIMSSNKQETIKSDKDYSKLLYARPSCKPAATREESVLVMKALMGGGEAGETQTIARRPPLSNVFGEGPLFLSDLHESTKDDGVIVGIDEAGRGSVLGPMIYGAAFWNASSQVQEKIPKDFNDSKQLTDDVRAKLLDRIFETAEMGFAVRVLHASEISRNMLRPEPYNLNQMSHDSAISIIQALLDAGVKISCCYIDTVGIADHYKRKLEREFPGLQLVVESKADAKYPCCSAGSVVAKVVRDRMLENWQFSEPSLALSTSTKFGSGYPSDPVCKQWMEDNLNCKTFAYPDVVRFSWAPVEKKLEDGNKAAKVVFAADIEDDEDEDMTINKKRQQDQMSAFLGKKQKRLPYFQRKGLKAVSKFF